MKPALALILSIPLFAQSPAAFLEQKTLARLAALDARSSGVLGVAAIDLRSGRAFSYHGDLLTTQASLIKVPILATAFQMIEAGALNLDKNYTLTKSDIAGGDGTLDRKLAQASQTLSLLELLTLMIRDSDNTATNKVISLVTLPRVNALLLQLNLPKTRLRRVMMDAEAAKRDDENTSTPQEMARLFQLLFKEQLVSPRASRRMIELLKLPKADFRATLPAEIEVAAKPGAVPGVHTEAGLVFLQGRPYALAVMASLLSADENPLRDTIEIVHAHFATLAASNQYGHRTTSPLH